MLGYPSMQGSFLDNSTGCISQRVNYDKCRSVNLIDNIFDPADFQSRHHTVQNMHRFIGHSTSAIVYRNAATQDTHDSFPDFITLFGHDDYGVVFLDTVDQK
jgi:hypothetical protein